jgi:hypothetical protein
MTLRQLSAKPGEDPRAPSSVVRPLGRRREPPREGLHAAHTAFAFVAGSGLQDISFTI